MILLVLVAGTFAVYAALRRGVVAPLEEAGRHFDRIAQGRLDQPIAGRGTNEIGHLFAGLASMQASVARTVRTVRETADSIHIGANEIATGNADLSARTENQAASLEVVEQADEIAGVESEGFGQSGLGGGAVVAQQREQHQVSGSQVTGQGALGLALGDAREVSEQRQRLRGVRGRLGR